MRSPSVNRKASADAAASLLWQERCDILARLLPLGRERRRLMELLPWWAAPGRDLLRSDGGLEGSVQWYPALSEQVRLPEAGLCRIRVSQLEILQRVDRLWGCSDARKKVAQSKWQAELDNRIELQDREKKSVGLPALERQIKALSYRIYDIDKEMQNHGERGSTSALAALLLIDFSRTEFRDTTIRGGGWSSVSRYASLKQAAPACRGLLGAHVRELVAHPRKERSTCRFLDIAEDATETLLDLGRVGLPPDAIVEAPAMDQPARAA